MGKAISTDLVHSKSQSILLSLTMCVCHLNYTIQTAKELKGIDNTLDVFMLSLGFKNRETRNKWENMYFIKQFNKVKLSLSVR